MKSFKDKLVLITGGSSGIGLALAKELVSEGSHVWILARDQERLDNALAILKNLKIDDFQKLGAIKADVTNLPDVSRLLKAWTRQNGTPDLLINSAGVAHPGYFQELELDIFHWTMDVNYFGTVNVIKAVIPDMISRGSGYIVNLSSQAGFIGVFGYTAYGASKYAVRGFSDALRAEMKPLGINLSIVFPPDTDTPQLTYEEQFKPFETKVIAGSSKTMPAEKVANIILSGVKRNKYMIIPGIEGKLFYRLTSILKNLTYPIMDMMVKSAQKKKKLP
ncbi:MAG: SDR family oxidoreductase [Chloroflexota bacterium]